VVHVVEDFFVGVSDYGAMASASWQIMNTETDKTKLNRIIIQSITFRIIWLSAFNCLIVAGEIFFLIQIDDNKNR